ncbi:hypothetical protein [Salibacterium halotolerans]|uniref:Uncharacterized protein n=1 Tax=Salibacterium halotolerans TaxID=1884432 RepID=A0A1I5UW37_9BACI|nr:hypothetical protein [Salibacterium halotolerans]SFP99419.1 hypothetical protein SAMN05518683_11477 [Salibacterium halotolerans]
MALRPVDFRKGVSTKQCGDFEVSVHTTDPVPQEEADNGISGVSEITLGLNPEFMEEGGWIPCKLDIDFVGQDRQTLTNFGSPFFEALKFQTGYAEGLADALEFAAEELRKQHRVNAEKIKG